MVCHLDVLPRNAAILAQNTHRVQFGREAEYYFKPKHNQRLPAKFIARNALIFKIKIRRPVRQMS